MEIANALMGSTHGCSFLDTKRYPKGPELDNGGLGDVFGIDDLFDFSSEEMGAATGEVTGQVQGVSSATAVVREPTIGSSKASHMPYLFEASGAGDICVPCEDIAQLEWLSNFVEESFSSADTTLMLSQSEHDKTVLKGKERSGSVSPDSGGMKVDESLNAEAMMVRGRARRSKRSRNGVCFWNTRILWACEESCASMLETSSTSSSVTAIPVSLESDISEEGGWWVMKKGAKRGAAGQEAAPARRCLHCGIQRTPQWRGGPMGPKTLCNACGVRFKSGRLLPEYRPAASPTFVESIHSNSHRKVLELRKQRELVEMDEMR